MKWRIIVNMSLTGRGSSALRNAVKKCLRDCHVTATKHNSRSWEGTAVNPVKAAEQLKKIFDYLAAPGTSNYRGQIDHLLIYIDRAKN